MAQFEFIEWLLLWLLETSYFEFDWDQGNSSKNETKHKVLASEIEQVFKLKKAVPLGIQLRPKKKEDTYGIVGMTEEGRLLMIAFTLRSHKVRAISARPASQKERKYYEAFIREIS